MAAARSRWATAVRRKIAWEAVCCCFLLSSALFAQSYEEALKSFEQGRAGEARQILESVLKEHARELGALALMGVALDSEQDYEQAEGYYKRALELAPRSIPLLNNMGNHYRASGDAKSAREFYRRVVALEPHHANANLQLAEMSVADKQAADALGYLNRVRAAEQAEPGAQVLRGQALALNGRCTEAAEILGQFEKPAAGDSRVHFSIGLAYVECKRYQQAEQSFARALELDPQNFDTLYNLGMASGRAGHLDRAVEVFQIALRQRPESVDCLYALAGVEAQQRHEDLAAGLLVQAQRLAPERPDVLMLLAQVTEKLGFYGDAASAYDQYLKLRPRDQVARRERGFAWVRSGKYREALPDLQSYVRQNPRDAIGFYELATAEVLRDRVKAYELLNQALALDSSLLAARYTRAVLNFEDERPERSLEDLRFIVKREPANYRVLTWLGQAHLRLEQSEEAAQVLKQAVELQPNDRTALMLLSKALRKLGRKEESAATLASFKQAASSEGERPPRSGLLEYLSLRPTEQRAQYLVNLERSSAANPADARLKARLGQALLGQGKLAEAVVAFRQVRALTSDGDVLADCGRALLRAQQYAEGRDLLAAAVAANPPVSGARLDLAIAIFHLVSAEAGLSELDQTPAAERQGDYYLLRAQILDTLKRFEEAADSLNRGIRAAPTRASLYLEAARFLIQHRRRREAAELLEQAAHIVPDAPELLLAQAIVLELLKHEKEAEKLLAQIQSRWPEWDRSYLISGIILENHHESVKAREMLDAAVALGADFPEVYYYQALAITHAVPEDTESARTAISQALALHPADPYTYLLAGKISAARRDYTTAVEQLAEALRLEPRLVAAHYALRSVYKAMGDPQKSAAELKEIERITRENPFPDEVPSPLQELLFTVRPPGP